MIYFKNHPSAEYNRLLNDYESIHKSGAVNSKIKTLTSMPSMQNFQNKMKEYFSYSISDDFKNYK